MAGTSISTFDVIAEPNRRRILDLLCAEQRSVGELSERLELSQPTVSKHLRVLRQARLVYAEVSAQRRLYRLNPAPLLELEAWLEPYRKFWNERLDALGLHLDRRAAARTNPATAPAARTDPATAPAAGSPQPRRNPRGKAPVARVAARRKVKR